MRGGGYLHKGREITRDYGTYPIQDLLDHAVPLAIFVWGTVFSIRDEFDAILETNQFRYLLEQFDTESFIAVVSPQDVLRLLGHHIRWFLWRKAKCYSNSNQQQSTTAISRSATESATKSAEQNQQSKISKENRLIESADRISHLL